jgi:hypothetical protein
MYLLVLKVQTLKIKIEMELIIIIFKFLSFWLLDYSLILFYIQFCNKNVPKVVFGNICA